jgi:preprotein translocase subunit YajC
LLAIYYFSCIFFVLDFLILNSITIAGAKMSILLFAADAAAKPQGNALVQMGPMIIIFGLMIFFMIWSQKKQAKKRQEMINSITSGSEIITAGGIHAKIVEVKDQTFIVSIADKVNIEINRSGVSNVVPVTDGQSK